MEEGVTDADASLVHKVHALGVSDATRLLECVAQLHEQGHRKVPSCAALLAAVHTKLGERPGCETDADDEQVQKGVSLSPMLSRLPMGDLKTTAACLQTLLDCGITKIDCVRTFSLALSERTCQRHDTSRPPRLSRDSSKSLATSDRFSPQPPQPNAPPLPPPYEYHDNQDKAFDGDYSVVDCELCRRMVMDDSFKAHWANNAAPPGDKAAGGPKGSGRGVVHTPSQPLPPLETGTRGTRGPTSPTRRGRPEAAGSTSGGRTAASAEATAAVGNGPAHPGGSGSVSLLTMPRPAGVEVPKGSESCGLLPSPSARRKPPPAANAVGDVARPRDFTASQSVTSLSGAFKETAWAESGDADAGSPAADHTLNEYHVLKELGKGCYGVTRLARHTSGGSFVVKTLHKASAALQEACRGSDGDLAGLGLLRDVAIMKRMDHRHLTRMHDVVYDAETRVVHFVVDYCEAGRACPAGQRLPLKLLRRYAAEVAAALGYVHARGLAHGGITLDNILLNAEDVVRLADFAVAPLCARSSPGSAAAPPAITPFTSPEALSGGRFDQKLADIWALGVVVYAMGFGELPFPPTPDAGGAVALAQRIARADPAYRTEALVDGRDEERRVYVEFLQGLLAKSPPARLGAGGGYNDILRHAFLASGGGAANAASPRLDIATSPREVTPEDCRAAVKVVHGVALTHTSEQRDLASSNPPSRRGVGRFVSLRPTCDSAPSTLTGKGGNGTGSAQSSPRSSKSTPLYPLGRVTAETLSPKFRPAPPPGEAVAATASPHAAPAPAAGFGDAIASPRGNNSGSDVSDADSRFGDDDSDEDALLMTFSFDPLKSLVSQEQRKTVSTFVVHRGGQGRRFGGGAAPGPAVMRQRRSFRTEEEVLQEQAEDGEAPVDPWRVLVSNCIAEENSTLLMNCISFPGNRLPGDIFTRALGAVVTVLRVNLSGITEVPSCIDTLEKVTELNLAHNSLTEVPASLGNLKHLTHLSLNNNALKALPDTVSKLSTLTHINLDYNKLTAVPPPLVAIPELRTCFLASNDGITAIPDTVEHWTECQLTVTNKPSVMASWRGLLERRPEVGSRVTVQWNKLYPDCIEEGVYLGSLRTAQSETILQELGITRIVTCGKGLVVLDPLPEGLEQIEILVDDMLDQKLGPYFQDVSEYIANARGRKETILVHCFAGLSRSASFLCAYYILRRGMTFKEAITFLKRSRPACNPNATFRKELIDLEESVLGTRLDPTDIENHPNGPADDGRSSRTSKASFRPDVATASPASSPRSPLGRFSAVALSDASP